MEIRGITKDDFDEVVRLTDQWWGGPAALRPLPIFFYEFGEYALIAEEHGQMMGFLLGFVTAGPSATAYVHLIGIEPRTRRRGVARALYEAFIARAVAEGVVHIKAITTLGNEGSVAFHRALGFTVEEVPDYAGPGNARYVFRKEILPSREP